MHIGAENSLLPPSRRYSDSDTSGDQNSDYMFLQVRVFCPYVPLSGLVSNALPLLLQLGGLQPSYREKSPNFEHKIEFVKVTDALMNTAFAQRFNFISLKVILQQVWEFNSIFAFLQAR